MSSGFEIDKKDLIEGLGKGLKILEVFSYDRPNLTSTEAGKLTGLTRTAARRYLLSLVYFGYADTDGKHYWLKPKALNIGQGYLDSSRIPRLVAPFLQRLSIETGETANFSILDAHDIVYLIRSNSPDMVSIGFNTGARIPAHCVSPGYVLLSKLSKQDLDAWIKSHTFNRFTAYTVCKIKEFRKLIQQAREQDFFISNQCINLALAGISVPLTNRKGDFVGALSITYQAKKYSNNLVISKLLTPLQEAVDALRGII